MSSPEPAAETVVLVHGLFMPAISMLALAWRLRRCGFRPVLFGYRARRAGVAGAAARLHAFAAGQPAETVHFVAHSLGGLVVRRLFEDHPDQRPGRVVTLGTPHGGSEVARRLAARRWGRWLLGRSYAEGLSGAAAPWDSCRELGVVAGSRPVGAGWLFASLPRPHDGTVALSETRLAGVSDQQVLPVSHTQMLVSAAVAEAVCRFLRHGRFGSRDLRASSGRPAGSG